MANSAAVTTINIPEVKLSSPTGDRKMPVIGLGTAVDNLDEAMKLAVLEAIKLGYRHFDTASKYGSEKPLGEAISEAVKLGLVTREELFITTKLWCTEAHKDLVVPSLQKSLRNLQMEYVDLYLIHCPISAKPGEKHQWPIPKEDLLPMDYKVVWESMEECQRLGLTKCIGVSNFSRKKLETILSVATIPPSVNQVEMNPVWQQRKLREYCKAKDIIITAFSPLGAKGASWGTNRVLDDETLKQIANAHGKTIAQVCLRWIFEQGATIVVKSFNKERIKENLEIFDWGLSGEDYDKINQIEQHRLMPIEGFVSPHGPFKTLEDLWDEDS
ncbi:non-functional NADPH-dependent codeinone reductase 2-like [Mangifera indica]|uniref:non-functional NADPH-dependent codeinone reductase 2-like n=1 Tax=Mangifera indica TaxID=29780 RepID=UPI001CFA0BC0|nr:non-functional NADPH-dependent codeinone reductase 2-like [Mangifera indica]